VRKLFTLVPLAAVAVAATVTAATLATPASAQTWSDTVDGFAQGTTGGAGGQTVTVTTQDQLNQYVTASEPYVIRVAGTINISPKGTELRVASNKTIIGVGTSGHIVGGGFFIGTGVSNVIIRNLTIRDTLMPDDDPGDDAYDYDAIQIDTASRIWIDHNRLSRMNDGLLDSRKDTTRITVSWNHFDTNNKTFGIGWTDNVTAQMTVHHNWFQNTNSRNPSADNLANIHLYNNYLQNVTGYGHFVRGLTKAVIENSYFDTVKDPYYVEAGELVQRGNVVVNSTWGSGRVREKGSAFNPSSFYSYTLALDGVSIGFRPGSFTAIMGPSGSGKTTFLHCAAGLARPTSGSVVLDGHELTRMSEKALTKLRRTRLGFVFQAFNLLPTLDVAENIALPIRLAGRRPRRADIHAAIERVGLAGLARRRPGELSGGQQQRVAIARALITQPAVIFGDEPTGSLDTTTSLEVLALLRQAVRGLGQTVVIVTHDPVAAAHADRVVFLADGRIAGELREPSADAVAERMTHLGAWRSRASDRSPVGV
jgi:pectate lyase